MSKLISGLFAGAVAVLTMSHSAPAAAASTWNLGTTCDPAPAQGTYVVGGNTATCATGVPAETMTATAWSNIGTGSTFLRASMGDFSTNGIGVYSGSNETSNDAQHAFDNISTTCKNSSNVSVSTGCGGTQEFMLINFGPYKVDLDALSIGYRSVDADVAVLRWDGADTTAAAMSTLISGKSTSTLTSASNGWTLVATESLDSTPDTTVVDFGGKVSSWWIVSTYYGTAAASTAGTLTTGDDKFKLSALTATVCTTGVYTGGNQGNGGTCGSTPPGVPEPGSLALAGLALMGVFASRRKVKALF